MRTAAHWLVRVSAWSLVLFMFILLAYTSAHSPGSESFFEVFVAVLLVVWLAIYVS